MQAESLDFRVLHRSSVTEPSEVRRLLRELRDRSTVLQNGMDRKNRLRRAWIKDVRPQSVILRHENIELSRQSAIYLSFEHSGSTFVLAAKPSRELGSDELEIQFPDSIHHVERRSGLRDAKLDVGSRVELRLGGGDRIVAWVADSSSGGIGLRVRAPQPLSPGVELQVRYLDGSKAGTAEYGVLRHRRPGGEGGWQRLGLSVTPVPPGPEIPVEHREGILARRPAQRAWRRIALAGRTLQVAPARVASRVGLGTRTDEIDIVEYRNNRGQPIRGILNRTGITPGGPAVVIPPAWGRTKETLLPLAATLIETFRAAGSPLTVLRFDGTQRRGESFIDPECRSPGDETLHFTYEQAARDVEASARFLQEAPGIEAARTLLVTFSLAAIEGRRALSIDSLGRFDGWISVVGMADVQSAMKSVSGGIDYVLGSQLGVRFGTHELGGVRIDIDRAAENVVACRLGTFEDARQDMAAIKVPVTWIHGRYDGWTSLSQIRSLVSAGDISRRKLIEIPTGHQLRNSQEALEAFELISEEAASMLGVAGARGRTPNLARLERSMAAERRRAPSIEIDVRRFWHDYLIGKDETVGMQLLSTTNVYRAFMAAQIKELDVGSGASVLDLGCGTGEFPLHAAGKIRAEGWRVVCVDLVPEALQRARARARAAGLLGASAPSFAAVDAELRSGLPFVSDSFDAVIASLVISYVADPDALLGEARRLLRPGGRLVLSSPKRDADLSSLYRQMMEEMSSERAAGLFGQEVAEAFDEVQRNYLNEAARLVDIEESGRFRFRDADELSEIVEGAGFEGVKAQAALGSPPQTVIVVANRA